LTKSTPSVQFFIVQDLLIFIELALMITGFVCCGLFAQRARKLLSQEEKLTLVDSPSRLRIFGPVPLMLIMCAFGGVNHIPVNYRWPAYFGIWLLVAVYFVILKRLIFRRLGALKINSDYQKAQAKALCLVYLGFFALFILSTLSSFVPNSFNARELVEYVRLHRSGAWAYERRGYKFAEMGEYDKAIKQYNEAIRLDPKSAWTYASRGVAYTNQGKLDEAINDFNQAIQLDPKAAWVYCQRGTAYSSKGEYDKAISDFSR
jgi:tetratricopeptide (TPR) repeat protein